MADKNSKNGSDETEAHLEGIDEVGWGGDDFGSSPAPAASSKASVFDEEDPFAEPGASVENFFEIEQMPDATSSDDGFGGDDFGDLQSDGDDAPAPAFSAQTAAGADEDPFADDPFAGDDAPAHHDEGTDGDEYVDDPFADVSEPSSAAQEQAAPAAAASSGKGILARHRNMVLGVVGVAAAAVAVVYGAPMFLGGGPAVTVTQPAPIQSAETSFPTALPTQNSAGQEVAQNRPPLATPALATPALPTPALPTPAVADDKPAAPALSIDLPSAPSMGIPKDAPLDQALGQLGAQPVKTDVAKTDPVDDLVGGVDRGGIDAVKNAPASAPIAAGRDLTKDVDALIARLDGLEGKVDKLADGFDKIVQAQGSTVAVPAAQTVEVPAAASSDAVPPMKPPIVEAASLKGVAGDLAWVSTKSGVVEVRVGDVVPNAGKVVAIRNYRDQWIVVTTDGLIVRQ